MPGAAGSFACAELNKAINNKRLMSKKIMNTNEKARK
jgi:hypothetical protein